MTCTNSRKVEANSFNPPPISQSQAEVKKKMSKKKNLKKLLKYQQWLVKEKGLPPSRIMLDHAQTELLSKQKPAQKEFKCEICDITCSSQNGLNVQMSNTHWKPNLLNNYKATIKTLSENVRQN